MYIVLTIGFLLLVLVLVLINKKRKQETHIRTALILRKYAFYDNLIKKAQSKFFKKEFHGSVAIADKILSAEPENLDALICRANSLEALNFNLDAISDYKKAISIDPTDGNFYGLLGLTYKKIGEINACQENLRIAIQCGLKHFEPSYFTIESGSELFKERLAKKGKNPENLLKRNPSDFIDNLEPFDQIEYEEAFGKQLQFLEGALMHDPNNSELKRLYNFAKNHHP